MKVADLMTLDVASCGPYASLSHAAWIMWDRDCGSVPVVGDDNQVIGVITDRDISMAFALSGAASEQHVQDVMTREVFSCAPEDSVSSALETLRTRQVHRLPVLNAKGELRGILSLSDIVLAARKPDERAQVIRALQGICTHRKPALATAEEAV